MPKSVFTDAYGVFLEELVKARREAGLTQVQLAKKLERPQPFISYFERGERRVDVIEFVAIARALGVDPETLFLKILGRLPEDILI